MAGDPLAALTVGMSWSPLLLSTGRHDGAARRRKHGARRGHRLGGPGPLAGAHAASPTRPASRPAPPGWSGRGWACCWPGASCRCCSTGARSFARCADLRRCCAGVPATPGAPAPTRRCPGVARRLGCAALVLGLVAIAAVGRGVFGLHVAVRAGGVVLAALVLAVVSSRATGETDLRAGGRGRDAHPARVLRLRARSSRSWPARSRWGPPRRRRRRCGPSRPGSGWAGRRARSSGRRCWGRSGGAGRRSGLPGDRRAPTESAPRACQRPSAISWKATAEAVRGGLAALPLHAPAAGRIGLLRRGRAGVSAGAAALRRWLPSPAAMGIAMLMPASLSLAALVGAVGGRRGDAPAPQRLNQDVADLAGGRRDRRRVGDGRDRGDPGRRRRLEVAPLPQFSDGSRALRAARPLTFSTGAGPPVRSYRRGGPHRGTCPPACRCARRRSGGRRDVPAGAQSPVDITSPPTISLPPGASAESLTEAAPTWTVMLTCTSATAEGRVGQRLVERRWRAPGPARARRRRRRVVRQQPRADDGASGLQRQRQPAPRKVCSVVSRMADVSSRTASLSASAPSAMRIST